MEVDSPEYAALMNHLTRYFDSSVGKLNYSSTTMATDVDMDDARQRYTTVQRDTEYERNMLNDMQEILADMESLMDE
eukprot:1015434-Amphidinium_carterae.1